MNAPLLPGRCLWFAAPHAVERTRDAVASLLKKTLLSAVEFMDCVEHGNDVLDRRFHLNVVNCVEHESTPRGETLAAVENLLTNFGWVMTVGEMLMPIVGAMRRELLAATYIQADGTPVDVQTHDRRGKNHQAYLWQYGTPGASTVFDFRLGRGREGPARFLDNFEGILQTDGYVAYDRGVGGTRMVHAACWSHARRQFVDAIKLNKLDTASIGIVELMDKLFAIDARARDEKMNHAARHALRQQEAPPLLEKIREQILAMSRNVLPKSAAGKACIYTLTLWKRLEHFLDYPELELSNNLAENSMRGVALGRKNWRHIGSQQAGPKVAAILSVVEDCRRIGLPIREYLAAVLPGLDNRSIHSLEQLTPAGYAASKLK